VHDREKNYNAEIIWDADTVQGTRQLRSPAGSHVQPEPGRAHGQLALAPVPSLVLAPEPEPAYAQRPVRQKLTAGEEGTLVVEERVVVLAAGLLFVGVVVFAAAAGLAPVAGGEHVGEDGGS